jgi:2-keto-4-pentenoate hydratase/2-oxohepta-3-ene-1,7-dioic acid hydratase in catechol pathway
MRTRLVTFLHAGVARPGVLLNDAEALDLEAAGLPYASMQQVVEAGLQALDAIRAAARTPRTAAVRPLAEARLLAPMPRPRRNVFCVGRNYMDHVAEGDRTRGLVQSELPKYPQFFTKAPETVIGPEDVIPDHGATGVTRYLDYEAELALVIGAPGAGIAPEAALSHVFGWTIANDVTGRDLQRRYGQWFKGKSLDRSCPMGPWIIPATSWTPPTSHPALGQWRAAPVQPHRQDDLRRAADPASPVAGLHPAAGDVVMTGTPEGVGYAMQPPQVLKGRRRGGDRDRGHRAPAQPRGLTTPGRRAA